MLSIVILIVVILAGVFIYRSLPVDAFPDVTPTLVQVFTETDGLSPEEVERYVTYPIEQSMAGLPKLEKMRSISNFGLSVINIYFNDGTDIYFARQMVTERLSEARENIPVNFGQPTMGPISTGLGLIMYYRLEDQTGTRSLVEIREIQDWLVKFPLQSISGVTEVLSLGGYEKQYQIELDPDALIEYDIDIQQVIGILENSNRSAGAQYINIGAEQYTIRGIGMLHSIEDIENTVVKVSEGRAVYLKDLGIVQIGGGVRQGLATANAQGEVVAGLVLKLFGSNTSEVIKNVKSRFAEINTNLPDGIKAIPYYDQGELISSASSTITSALWQGALCVAFIIFLFLGGWRSSLVVVLSIPFSVAFAFIFMKLFNISANLMSLGGIAIAIGLMVDGAIVIVENIDRTLKLKASPSSESRYDIITKAIVDVLPPLIASVIVVVTVFLPLFSLQGVEGKTFRPLAAATSLAMLGSLLYAVLIAPALATILMHAKNSPHTNESALGAEHQQSNKQPQNILQRFILPISEYFIKHKKSAVALAGFLLLLGLLASSRLGSEFTPSLEEGDIQMRITMAPSISLDEAALTVTKIEKRLLNTFPEISSIVSRIGRGEVGAHADPTNSAEAFIELKNKEEWRSHLTAESLRNEISENLEKYPGVIVNIGQPIAMSVDELLTGTRAELAIKVFGSDLDVLIEKSNQVQNILRTVPGASDVQVDQVTGVPQLVVDLNHEALGRYGLNTKEVLDTLSASVGGFETGVIFEGVRQFPIILRLQEAYRDSPEMIERLRLQSESGATVTLGSVADVKTVIGPRQLTREDGEQFITVQTNVRGRDIGSFVSEAQNYVEKQVELPAGYRIVWGGQFELQQKANKRFSIVIPLTLILVLLILLFTYRRLRSVILIMLNVPLALTGGALALWLANMPISVPATVGFIALFGIALGNGMVLVSFMDEFALQGINQNRLAIDATRLRIRPVCMTALTTALGLAPLLFATGVGAEVQRPLAMVVTGGLVTSTILTLWILPALHSWFSPKQQING